MKRVSTFAVCAAVLALTLTACSSNDPGNGDEASTAPTDLSAEISYSIWDENQVDAVNQNIKDFNAIYPNIKVTVNVTPWAQFWTKLQTQGESKTLPDVFWMNGPNIQLYASNGLLEPISSEIDPANYPDSLNGLYTVDDVQYGVPKDFDTVALWYNKAIFAKAGVELPTADWTWADFATASKAISDKLKGEGIYGESTPLGGQESYYNTILQAGGEIISDDGTKAGFDSEAGVAGLKFWADLVADGSSPTPAQLTETEGKVWFASGKSAMVWTGTWAVAQFLESDYKTDFDVIDLPKGERRATVIHGLANVVAADSKNKEAAQAFQAYLGSEEAETTQAQMGAANPAFNGTQKAFVDSAPDWNLQVFEDAGTDYSFAYPVSKNTQAWNELETNLLPGAFAGDKPVADVAKDLATQMNELLAVE